jgi:hypothetical protein
MIGIKDSRTCFKRMSKFNKRNIKILYKIKALKINYRPYKERQKLKRVLIKIIEITTKILSSFTNFIKLNNISHR